MPMPRGCAPVGVVNDEHVVALQQVLADDHRPARSCDLIITMSWHDLKGQTLSLRSECIRSRLAEGLRQVGM